MSGSTSQMEIHFFMRDNSKIVGKKERSSKHERTRHDSPNKLETLLDRGNNVQTLWYMQDTDDILPAGKKHTHAAQQLTAKLGPIENGTKQRTIAEGDSMRIDIQRYFKRGDRKYANIQIQLNQARPKFRGGVGSTTIAGACVQVKMNDQAVCIRARYVRHALNRSLRDPRFCYLEVH